MKKTLLLLACVLLTSISASAAPRLNCHTSPSDGYSGHIGFAVIDSLSGHCEDKNGNRYEVTMEGFGASMHIGLVSAFTVTCPFVKKSRLVGNYYGAKVVAGFIPSLAFGVAVNERMGACFVGVAEVGLGAGATISRLTIGTDAPDLQN